MAVTQIKSYNSDLQAEVTVDHELKVAGNFTANNSSVGPTGAPAPADATLVAGIAPGGDLEGLKVDASGNLLVTTAGFITQDLVVKYNEVTAVAIGPETSINTYTAPAGKVTYLLSITASGGNRGKYNVYNNGVAFDTQYTQVTQLSSQFDYKTGSDGAAAPSVLTSIGGVDGSGNLQAMSVDTSGRPNINIDGSEAIWQLL